MAGWIDCSASDRAQDLTCARQMLYKPATPQPFFSLFSFSPENGGFDVSWDYLWLTSKMSKNIFNERTEIQIGSFAVAYFLKTEKNTPTFVRVWVCGCMHVCHQVHAKVRGQLNGVASLPLCRSSWYPAEVDRLGGKWLNLMSHLASPQ